MRQDATNSLCHRKDVSGELVTRTQNVRHVLTWCHERVSEGCRMVGEEGYDGIRLVDDTCGGITPCDAAEGASWHRVGHRAFGVQVPARTGTI